jgi:hypothetical protein
MKNKFADLLNYLKKIKAPNIEFILPGESKETILDFFSTEFSLDKKEVPEQIVELYTNFGGTKLEATSDFPKVHLFPIYMINSIEYSKLVISTQDSIYNFKKTQMFPLFSSGYGEHLTVKLEDIRKLGSMAPIYYTYSGNPNRQGYVLMYSSFEALINTITICYQKDLYFFEDNCVEEDFDGAWQLSKKNNSKAEYWN